MEIGLTGCTGFVGAHLTHALVQAGHQVTGLVRPDSRADHVTDDLSRTVVGDLCDAKALRTLADACDIVVHNAFESVSHQPMRHFRANVLGSLQLLELARIAGISQFIFISSTAAYHTIEKDRLLDERHPMMPSDLPGACKAAVEPFLTAYFETYGVNGCAFRLPTVYGIHHDWKRSWNYDIINSVTLGEEVDTPGSAHVVHVDDVTEAVIRALGNYSVAGQVYNLVDCHIHDEQVARMAKEITGSPSILYDRHPDRVVDHFVTTKAVDDLAVDLARGHDGVGQYVRELLDRFA